MKPVAAGVNDHAARAHANRISIVAMVAAMACFIVNDTLVKYVSQDVPAAQLIFIRSAMASLLVLVVAVATGAGTRIREIGRGRVIVRAGLDGISTLLYLVSLFQLPIATATSIYSTLPLLVTMLAALVLGERVRSTLWLATVIGFAGVLLMVQPQSGGLDFYAGVCFVATAIMAVRDIVTSRLRDSVPSIIVALSTMLVVTVLAGVLSLIEGWQRIPARDLGMLTVAAISLASAYAMIVRSTRRGDLSVVAPFRYSALLFAMIVGYLVWGDAPNALAWCGAALLLGSGVYVVRTSQRSSIPSPSLE